MGFLTTILLAILLPFLLLVLYATYHLFIAPYFSPLRNLPGPPVSGRLDSHLPLLLDANKSVCESEKMVKQHGRTFRIQGMGAHDDRLITFDAVAVSHILNRSTVYEKPWQSRRLITWLIGEGMLAAEGNVHKRQRKVSNPVFSHQNLRALMPIFFGKAEELRERWTSLITKPQGTKIDVSHWLGRATFDIIGLAGFDYPFNAIQDESNEVYLAYRDMFEIGISRGQDLKSVLGIYFPLMHSIWPDERSRVVAKCKDIVFSVGRKLVQQKKKELLHESETGLTSKDLLSLLLKSNVSTEIPEEQRISDDDILNQISTFLFAGSDTSSMALSWTFYLLALHPDVQKRLRKELRDVAPTKLRDSWIDVGEDSRGLTDSATLFSTIDTLPYLDCVLRESLRLIPPIPSTLRVATQNDEIPLSEPMIMKDGSKRSSVRISKGQFVHVAMEGFNLDRSVWGDDGWDFNPDRWLDLPVKANEQPGLYPNLLTFSAGPRSCIGMRFAVIEMKVFLYMLVSNFVFSDPADIVKANVVLTRPYVRGKFKEGSQCPINVRPYVCTE